MKRYVIGDIHGNYKGLKQCLEQCNFDYENDQLISLGDIVDRGPQSYECVEELLKIKNLISIRGNHDKIFLDWINTGNHKLHFHHGAVATLSSYISHIDKEDDEYERYIKYQGGVGCVTNLCKLDIPKTHIDFFENQIPYYIDNDNVCFVHGGFNRHENIEDQEEEILYWDRDLVMAAMSFGTMTKEHGYKFKMVNDFKKVFVGHTPTLMWNKETRPMRPANIILMDTGGAYPDGKVSIMNVDTEQYWQSEEGKMLYDNFIK